MISLVNKTFFITGLGSGIGFATGQLLASNGAYVTGTVFSEDQQAAVSAFTQTCYLLDITDTDRLTQTIQCCRRQTRIGRHNRLCRQNRA